MKLLTKAIEAKLIKNSTHWDDEGHDPKPVVKFFNPMGAATWLITEMDEEGRMFGLCDLGMGSPELGSVGRDELEEYSGRFGLGIERDMYWKASKPLSEYTSDARNAQRIVA